MRFYIFILFFGLYTEGVAQNVPLEKQSVIIQNLPDDTVKVRQLYELAMIYNEENLGKGLYYFKITYSVAQKLKATDWLPRIETCMGSNYSSMAQPDSAFYYLELARQGFERQNKPLELGKVYESQRTAYWLVGNYKKGLEASFKALDIYEKAHDSIGIARANSGMGDVMGRQEMFEEGFKYAQKAYAFQKRLPQPSADLIKTCKVLGDISLRIERDKKGIKDLNQLQPAFRFQEEGLLLARQLGNKLLLARALNGYGNALKYLKQNDNAIAAYTECANITAQLQAEIFYQSVVLNLCDMYNRVGEYRKAISITLKQLALMQGNKNYVNLPDTYRFLAESYKGLGNIDSAFYYLKLRETYRDSLSVESGKLMADIQTKYETSQREAQIAEQKNALEKQRAQFWMLLAFLTLALIGGAWLYRLTRQLQARNEEKGFLIKEIHHRVKNNLQVLSSLLHLQSKHIKDDAALDAVREGQNRVEAMGLIHQKLYMGDNLAAVDMPDYLKNLGDTLLDSFGIEDDSIQIQYDVQNMHLDVDTAIPLGLIINELVTNSLKYAFPTVDFRFRISDVGEKPTSEILNPKYTEGGVISLSLWINETKQLCLKVSDNGVGNAQPSEGLKPSEGYHKNSTSFGTNLVQILSKKLKGKPEILQQERGYGTLIRFEEYKIVSSKNE